MATIKARRTADGIVRYTAEVRLRKGALVLHREAKTFTHRAAAQRWARARDVALEDPATLMQVRTRDVALKDLIRWYIDTFQKISKWQRTKQAQLQFLEKHTFALHNACSLTTRMLIEHVRERRTAGAGPATVANDLTWIAVVLRAAKSVRALPVRPDIVLEARTACRELRLIGKSRRRNRRPTPDELQKLDEYFSRRDRRAKLPMRDIMWFAIESSRRESEICHLLRADNDESTRTGCVRDAKHPTHKEGNHRRFKYTSEGWGIVMRQPREGVYVFPYNPRSVCAAFTRACHVLGIENLRFHDLRHEATSRLFERGYQIHEVAQFTLHESWNELKRYTNLHPERVRELDVQEAESLAKRGEHARDRIIDRSVDAVDQSVRPDHMHSPATVTSGLPA